MAEPDFAALFSAFRAKDRDRVIVGVAAAFAHVAVANGKVESSETDRFLDVVSGSRLAPSDAATRAALRAAFGALTQAMVLSPELGRADALRVLSDFGFDDVRRQIIWSAAGAALIADASLDVAEKSAALEIRNALRIRSGGP